MAIQEVRVAYTDPMLDTEGLAIKDEAERSLGITSKSIRTAKVYRVEGVDEAITLDLAEKLLYDEVSGQEMRLNDPLVTDSRDTVEVAYRPGVMNPAVESILKAAADLGMPLTAADVSTEYSFGDLTPDQIQTIVQKLLVNKTVQHVVEKPPETLLVTGETGPVLTVPVRTSSDEELMALSKDKLFLTLPEMQAVRTYFDQLDRDPTDCELEIIAARWSEHCVHKTFKAEFMVDGELKDPLFTRIKKASEKYFGDFVLSAFEDNAGVIALDEEYGSHLKVETHNSPSAIEPYGGAATGSGGVFRDIMATGQGGEVLLSMDQFCFAPPDIDAATIPPGCLHPDYLLRRVVAGVQTYGNNMGVPTSNGSLHFHPDFRAKPTVIVGSVGLIPRERVPKGQPRVNDVVVVIGGKTGRDGIHGATFSSGDMTDRTHQVNSTAVQIGDPITQQRMGAAIVETRDNNLNQAITDCGAAGLSSAVGEIGEDIGVTADTSKVPLKYPGLAPWEIWLSESQERLVAAVAPENVAEFQEICAKYNTEATAIGHFDGSNRLTVTHGDQKIADLDYEFLKNGIPLPPVVAKYTPEIFEEPSVEMPQTPTQWADIIKKTLGHWNVCSKQPIVRRYDHSVQGTSALAPFSGVHYDGPNDGSIITPLSHKPNLGVVTTHGMNPVLNKIDPYKGSKWAVTEALANLVAVGGDIDKAAMANNYIWPSMDDATRGSLDRSVDAVVDCIHAFQRPVISGKDSLSSRYRGKDGTVIDIPPVLCITVEGVIDDVSKTVSADIKKPGETNLYLVGYMDDELGGSTYYDVHGQVGNAVPDIDLAGARRVFKTMHAAIQSGDIGACHDVSEGGVIAALSEMAFGGDCGVDLDLPEELKQPERLLFNETAGVFVVEIADDDKAMEMFTDVPLFRIGKTTKEKQIKANHGKGKLFSVDTDELKAAWQAPMQQIFT